MEFFPTECMSFRSDAKAKVRLPPSGRNRSSGFCMTIHFNYTLTHKHTQITYIQWRYTNYLYKMNPTDPATLPSKPQIQDEFECSVVYKMPFTLELYTIQSLSLRSYIKKCVLTSSTSSSSSFSNSTSFCFWTLPFSVVELYILLSPFSTPSSMTSLVRPGRYTRWPLWHCKSSSCVRKWVWARLCTTELKKQVLPRLLRPCTME